MTPEARERVVHLAETRKELFGELWERPSGLAWCARHTDIADEVVRCLYTDLLEAQSGLPSLALIATGGYGRRELAPHSDIDITVVPSDEASPELDQAIRVLHQDLHWAFCTVFRMDVGYAYRLIADAPGLDDKTRTGLMDMRRLEGSFELARSLEDALLDSFSAGEFVLAKTTEREEMLAKHHDTPYVVEPNLKEGAGGLRCFQCANWLKEAIGERAARPDLAYDMIARYRNLLHLTAGRHLDLLSRQRQGEIAESLKTDPFLMMSEIVESGAILHGHYRRAKESLYEGRFHLSHSVLAVHGEAREVGNADAGDAAVGISIATKLGLRVSDIPFGATAGVTGSAALFALASGEATLRNLDRCGLLDRVLPELARCRTLIPTDSIHTYTVFEHTLQVVRKLDKLQPGSFLGDIKASLTDHEPLYLAALLHDVGKIDPERSHSDAGAEIAEDICARWDLGGNIREEVSWLIREHLTMMRYIRVRDVFNPQTVEDLTAIVQTPERLMMLALLTWADVSAVSDSAWNPTQEIFLRELYERTLSRLQVDPEALPDVAQTRQRMLRHLKREHDESKVQAFLNSLPTYYLTSTAPDVVRLHMQFVRKAEHDGPTIELFHREDMSATEVTVCARDRPGLLSELLGVFYAFDVSVSVIRACTTSTSPAIALDVFGVSFGGRPVPAATMQQVSAALVEVVEQRKLADELLVQHGKDPDRVQKVLSYAYIEGAPGIVELRTPRGRGMAYRLSRLIAARGWNVVSARVSQWADNATAGFYIQGPEGEKLSREQVDGVFSRLVEATGGVAMSGHGYGPNHAGPTRAGDG